MSYSFNVRGATVALAVAAVAPAFDNVVEAQPVHAKDREVALTTATAIASLVDEPAEGQEVSINVSGYLQWAYGTADADTPPEMFIGANVSVSASIVAKFE